MCFLMVDEVGVEPTMPGAGDLQSPGVTNFPTHPYKIKCGEELNLTYQFSQLSTCSNKYWLWLQPDLLPSYRKFGRNGRI